DGRQANAEVPLDRLPAAGVRYSVRAERLFCRMSVGGDGFDLDRLLDQELRRAAARLEGPSPRVGQSAYHAAVAAGGTVLSFSSLSSFLTSKVTIAATAALLLAGGAAVTA